MSWWIGIRKTGRSNRKMIIPQSFRSESEAEKEFATLRGANQPGCELCQPVEAGTEQDAIDRMKDLMGW